jgi:hypothetical protein
MEAQPVKRIFSIVGLVLVVAVALSGATTGPARSAGGVERVPVTCYAVWSNSGALWRVRILTPDLPYWLIDLIPAPMPIAQADGVAVFTPSGQVSVVCHDNPSILSTSDGSPLAGASTSTFSAHGPAYTARGEVPGSFFGIRTYMGNGTVVVNHGDFQISAQLRLDLST